MIYQVYHQFYQDKHHFQKYYFAKKSFKKEEKRVFEEFVYTINLDELNQNTINEIYNLAYRQNNSKNSKKLILRV